MSLIRHARASLNVRPHLHPLALTVRPFASSVPSPDDTPSSGPSRHKRPLQPRSASSPVYEASSQRQPRSGPRPGRGSNRTPAAGFDRAGSDTPRNPRHTPASDGRDRNRGGPQRQGFFGQDRGNRASRDADGESNRGGFGVRRDKAPDAGGMVIRHSGAPHRASPASSNREPRAGGDNKPEPSEESFDSLDVADAAGPSRNDSRRTSHGRGPHTAPSGSVKTSSRSLLDSADDTSEITISRNRDRDSRHRGGRGGINDSDRRGGGKSAREAQLAILYGSKGKDRADSTLSPTGSGNGKGKQKKVEVKEEKKVFIPSSVSVGRLADIFGVKIFNLQNVMQRLDLSEEQRRSDYLLTSEQACDLAIEYDLDPIVDDEAAFDIFPEPTFSTDTHPLRPPVVTIMGHVDHGKTTLLDSLRRTSVAAGEAGGITQHIGAFSVPLSSILPSASSSDDGPGSITFLDTPGHAAFSGMRARGASATDLVVLVVAADDGVMPQTKEVIELVKKDGALDGDGEGGVGLVVAINKCDKPGVDYNKVQSALGAEGVLLEEHGGETPSVRVSGLTGQGLDQLVETLSTLAEMRELRARRDGMVEGIVLESRVDKGRGNVATVLVQKGTLTAGTPIVAGTTWAKVRQMTDSSGRSLKSAGPGTPVSLMGWKDLPTAGDVLLQAPDEDKAKRAIANRLRDIERRRMLADIERINEKRQAQRLRAEKDAEYVEKLKKEGRDAEVGAFLREIERRDAKGEDVALRSGEKEGEGRKELRLLIKADVSGTVEAVVGSLEHIGNKEAGVKIVHTGVGEVGESDVHMAEATGATIVAFSVSLPKSILTLAQQASVPVRHSKIIYELIESVRTDVAALLPPIKEVRVGGEATVQQIFDIKLKGKEILKVAGCRVGNGVIEMKEGVRARVMRNKVGGEEGERDVVFEGVINTLKHLKKDVTEVRKGTECGIGLEGFSDIRVGDEIVSYTTVDVARTLWPVWEYERRTGHSREVGE